MKIPEAPRLWQKLGQGYQLLLFSGMGLVLLWAGIIAMLGWQRQVTLEQEQLQNADLARTLREHTLRILETVNQSMLRLAEASTERAPEPADYVRFANETGLVPGILTQLSLVGADGRFIGSNLDPDGQRSQRVDLSSRDHVRVHLTRDHGLPAQSLSPDGLFVSELLKGKVSGKRSIQLSRKVLGPNGGVRGVVVASLNPDYFESVYREVQLGRLGGVLLVGLDGVARIRIIGGQDTAAGIVIRPSFLATLRAEKEGSLLAESANGPPRLSGFSRVGNYPLVLAVGTTVETALASWYTLRNVAYTLTALLSVVLFAGALVVAHNLRLLVRQHEALIRSEARAQAASQAKSEFLVAISHELRTPLTSIQGFSELLAQRSGDARTREQAGMISRAAEHLNRLLSEILDLGRIEAGAMPICTDRVPLPELAREVVELFQVSAAAKNLQLHVELAPDLPAVLHTDGLRLKQILHNLLSNAIKFTEQGEVRLLVRQEEAAQTQGQQVLFQVLDTGPGVPAGMEEAIFEKFRQGHARISYAHGGTGLGLALSRMLAGLLGGSLRLDTPGGQPGASFTLRLPSVSATPPGAAAPNASPAL